MANNTSYSAMIETIRKACNTHTFYSGCEWTSPESGENIIRRFGSWRYVGGIDPDKLYRKGIVTCNFDVHEDDLKARLDHVKEVTDNCLVKYRDLTPFVFYKKERIGDIEDDPYENPGVKLFTVTITIEFYIPEDQVA